MDSYSIQRGEPFRNATEVMKQYIFRRVPRLNIVTLGISDSSQFDFGVSVSPLSIATWELLEWATQGMLLVLLIALLAYVYIRKLLKALKKRSHA